MLLALLLLAGPAHCADAAFCPSREEVERAFKRHQMNAESELNFRANPPGSGGFTTVSIARIVRVSGIRCSRPKGEARTVSCHATVVNYPNRRNLRTVHLIRDAKGWQLADTGGTPSG